MVTWSLLPFAGNESLNLSNVMRDLHNAVRPFPTSFPGTLYLGKKAGLRISCADLIKGAVARCIFSKRL